ncbi:alanine racemase [Campylobacter sp. VicNov18]|uniref:alanine racemase n=1 Tax=Campylobacter bilis TaxID=2691918 RepID=UPI00130DCE90|nr:alanine racemase [Campylobacter bilis]MPV63511.1 alanine racemase [Campylobacter hepaticus]MBM0637011.1 alanine racemase [Campylobacter bilis]MCC8277834.1 alanine racemase [Campylobacter bilis]MCC8299444.1 alanine racemase [Campylobacter bilis]MCC8300744.1 alanine racemase [Campylobacter bilis]
MSLIRINQKAYEYNLKEIAKKTEGFERIICVFKDNAYGHGAKLLAPVARELGINFIALKNEKEAWELEGIFENILILSHLPHGNENERFIYALNDISQIKNYKKNTKIHLKIDTGMHRNGVSVQELEYAMALIKKNALKLEGIFTHFANADEMDRSFFVQKEGFEKAKKIAKKYYPDLLTHSYNSAALFRGKIPEDEYCRIGLVQFGYGHKDLKKVLSLYAHRLSQRRLEKGQSIGYGGVFKAKEALEVANYDLGYADGLFRYDGKGKLRLANGKEMLGRMSMDSFSCEDCGEELCVFEDADVWADFFHTINYEILVKLHPDIPRVLV